MATKYSRKHQRTVLIITIVLCAAVLAATLFVTINSYVNTSPLFSDQDFAQALAEQLGVSPRNLTQEMLNDYEYIRITAMFTQPTADSPSVCISALHARKQSVYGQDHFRGGGRGGSRKR